MKRKYYQAFNYPDAQPYRKRRRFMYYRKKTAYSKASNALNLVKKLKNDVEVKELNTAGSNSLALVSTKTWNTVLLNPMARGDTSSTRNGDKYNIKSIQARFQIVTGATANDVDYRVVIVYDRNPLGVLATGADIYNVNSIIGNLNTANKKMRGRFLVLYNEMYHMKLPVEKEILLNTYIKRTLKVECTSNNGDITDIDKGAILLAWCKGITDTNAASTINYNVKIKYSDA